MTDKTHKTAVVLIPPRAVWAPIQAIRRRHDRQVRRWMPHVTLLYPFRPRGEFLAVADALAAACAGIEPFEVTLSEFSFFAHGPKGFTLWLAPEPAAPLVALQEAVWRCAADCDDVRRFAGGFTPHLSVGQVKGRARLERLRASLQADWRPLHFVAGEVAMIWRADPPEDVFQVDRTVALGGRHGGEGGGR
jgi:2'-5' RNA ligase